jgi:hypothetical protein
MTAELPRSRLGAHRSHSPSRRPLFAALRLRRTVASMMDGWVRGSYDITNAKYGFWRIGARRGPGIGGA